MKRLLIGIVSLFLSTNLFAVDRLDCEIKDEKMQVHITNEYDMTVLCNEKYTSFHSNLDRIPYLVIEKIGRQDLSRKEPRTNDFRSDLRLRANQRSELKDYYKSGYDRGHLAPSANYHSREDISQTFLLSNIVPQEPRMNRTIWKNIENYARIRSNLNSEAFIITGVTFNHCLVEEKLKSRVAVPDKFWKVIKSGNRIDVFMVDNINPESTKISDYRISLEELNDKLCGIIIEF